MHGHIKKNVESFLASLERDSEGRYPSSIDLLRDFIAFLAKKNKAFRDIPEQAISTNFKGLSQIYDAVRKKARSLLDEKPATPQKSKTKAQPSMRKSTSPE